MLRRQRSRGILSSHQVLLKNDFNVSQSTLIQDVTTSQEVQVVRPPRLHPKRTLDYDALKPRESTHMHYLWIHFHPQTMQQAQLDALDLGA
jgi:hypothetical protein